MAALQRNWQTSVLLSLLLLNQSFGAPTESSTEDPYRQYTENNEKFEVIDVTHQGGTPNTGEAGRTTRFFTTGDVDDDFWLKHLGEDFRHAIHLQVGGQDQPEGIFNMTNNGSPYEIHHEYLPGANPGQEDDDHNPMNGNYPKEPIYAIPANREGQLNGTNITQTEPEIITSDNGTTTAVTSFAEPRNETQPTDLYHQQPFEQTFAIDDSQRNMAIKYYNPQAYDIPDDKFDDHKRNHAYHTKPYKHLSPKHKIPNLHTQSNKDTKYKTTYTRNPANSLHPQSVIVTLPETRKTIHQLDENEEPVVVKMPPIIYHGKPVYANDQDHTDHTTTPTQTQTQNQQQTETRPTQSHTDGRYENPSRPDTFYESFQSQSGQFPEFSSPFFNAPPFNPDSVYSTHAGPLIENPESSASQGLRYILPKPPSGQMGYESRPAPEGSTFEDYTRVGRSSQMYSYYQGL